MNNNINDVRRSSKAISVIMLVVLCFVVAIFFVVLFSPKNPCCDGGGGSFGDEYLSCTYSPDAVALTPGGERINSTIGTLADPPTTVFSDDFEGASPWDVTIDVTVQTAVVHWGTKSALFADSADGDTIAYLSESTTISIDADETFEMYFYVNVTSGWDGGSGGKGENDYFVIKIEFADGKVMVYEVYGTYATPSTDEAVSDVSTQVTAKNIWTGINIKNIEDDYTVNFGGPDPVLPVPSVVEVVFELSTNERTTEQVYLDDISMIVEPEPFMGTGYWKVESGEKVSSYMVDIDYSVVVDNLVDDTVHVKVSLWTEIYHDSVDTANMALGKTLIEEQIVLLLPTEVSLPSPAVPVVLTWNSKVFALPNDDTVFGGNLYYTFYIQIEAWGELVSSPGDWVYAMDDNDGNAFDTLHFQYVVVDGSITIIVYTLGGVGIAGAGIGLIAARRKKRNSIDGGNLSERENLFN